MSGIGHERDDTITDLVAFKNLKTPTAVAEYIIEHNYLFEQQLIQFEDIIIDKTREIINKHKSLLDKYENEIPYLAQNIIALQSAKLSKLNYVLHSKVKDLFQIQSRKLVVLKQNLSSTIKSKLAKDEFMLELKVNRIKHTYSNSLLREKSKLNHFNDVIDSFDPYKVLKRGYTLIEQNNRIISKKDKLDQNNDVDITFHDGKIGATIKKEK